MPGSDEPVDPAAMRFISALYSVAYGPEEELLDMIKRNGPQWANDLDRTLETAFDAGKRWAHLRETYPELWSHKR